MAVLSASLPRPSNFPPATRYLTLALLVCSVVLALLRTFRSSPSSDPTSTAVSNVVLRDSSLDYPFFLVVPGSSIWFPWSFATAPFFETSFIEFLVSAFTLPPAARYLERVWGPSELLKFTAVVAVGSNIVAFVVSIIEYAVLSQVVGATAPAEKVLFGTQYHGLQGLQAGFLVAFTQLVPEHQVQLFFGKIKLRVKQLPMLYVTVSNVMCILGYQSPWFLIQFGWLISWFYLRFIKESDGVRGDRSETFAFANWFPPFLQPIISHVSNLVFDTCVRVGLVRPWSYGPADLEFGAGPGFHLNPANAGGGSGSPVPTGGGGGAGAGGQGGARAEAERRRALALKALDQRLAKGQQQQQQQQLQNGPSSSSPSSVSATTSGSGTRGAAVAAGEEPLPSTEAAGHGVSKEGEGATARGQEGEVLFEAPEEEEETKEDEKLLKG